MDCREAKKTEHMMMEAFSVKWVQVGGRINTDSEKHHLDEAKKTKHMVIEAFSIKWVQVPSGWKDNNDSKKLIKKKCKSIESDHSKHIPQTAPYS
jgi:hypothetical protein